MLVYDSDGREEETDMVFHARHADADRVYTLRTRAGGLICYATSVEVTRGLGIPFGDELLASHPRLSALASRRLGYGDRPAFTIWVNYVGVRTGISDEDRALTIRELHRVTEAFVSGRREEAERLFYANFQAPGHVPVLAARSLEERRGHTELTITLSRLAGLEPSVFFAEMLGRGKSLPLRAAEALAEEAGWPLVRGEWVVGACRDAGLCGGR